MLIRTVKIITFLFTIVVFLFISDGNAHAQATLSDVNTLFDNIIEWVVILGGFLAFLALIYGGFKYIMARGDPKAISSAQGTITWAIIGLVLIIIIYLVLVFIEEFTGQPVTDFIIRSPFPD